ncbi:hypothetical protein L1049_009286 [Liquidambar formosana]|uniref:Uncharacterized protein n=1 Tax=Liquidambar formosana TaxID=63359 RepID=A0AAP0X2T6_LIQFO
MALPVTVTAQPYGGFPYGALASQQQPSGHQPYAPMATPYGAPSAPYGQHYPKIRVSASSIEEKKRTRGVRFNRNFPWNRSVVCAAAAASAAGSSSPDSDLNPYEVFGVSPIEGFDMIKAAYTRKRKEAERRGDEATAARLEKAYDKVMMAQLSNRKKGVTFGSFKEDCQISS